MEIGASALAPANAEDQLSLSHLYLARFDFPRGWSAYEARLREAGADVVIPSTANLLESLLPQLG